MHSLLPNAKAAIALCVPRHKRIIAARFGALFMR